MAQVNPYINFNGKCREAMDFYKDCIGGDLMIMPVAGSPLEAQCLQQCKIKLHMPH
jgi:PhnB protein